MKLVIFKKRYHEWRYYSYLKRIMKKQKEDMNNIYPYLNKPGIIFSFDDSFRVNDWYKYGKEIFGYYDVKVTFNINGFHHFEGKREHTQKEIDMLLELQSNGHEIAHHGYRHKRAANYSSEVGISKWVEDDIFPLIKWMNEKSHSKNKEKFKKPVSYAFPHFNYDDNTIMELVPKYFKVVRGHLYGDNFTPTNHNGLVPSICIDSNYFSNIKYIKKIIKIAKQMGNNLILTCHSILPDEVKWDEFGWGGEEAKIAGNWRTSPKTIRTIIKEARSNGFEFYTTSEIAGVASFI